MQQYALKLLTSRATDLAFRARFTREQRILTTLQHTNLTRPFDAGVSNLAEPYLVTKYVGGSELTAFCDSRKLSLRQRMTLFLTICEAVAYAHSKLIVHLDLKPSNTLVTGDGVIRLLDSARPS